MQGDSAVVLRMGPVRVKGYTHLSLTREEREDHPGLIGMGRCHRETGTTTGTVVKTLGEISRGIMGTATEEV